MTGDDDNVAAGARAIAMRLRQAGFEALFAGGCVRDRLMQREPRDYDIATAAMPEDVERLFPKAKGVGKAFGVMLVRHSGHEYEVATFRRDHDYTDGRRPNAVSFADARQDAARRDFTINALFENPETGEIIDFVGGRADLAGRILRCVGEPRERFQEDHLRMLRAIRFSGTLQFTIHKDTVEAIKTCAPLITRISHERVRDELTRILAEAKRPGAAVAAMHEYGLLGLLLPEVAAMAGQEQPPEFHPEGDVLRHTMIMLDLMAQPSHLLAWAVLLHDVGKPQAAFKEDGRFKFHAHDKIGQDMARLILKRLCFSNKDTDAISYMVGNHMRFMEVRKMRRATLMRMVSAATFPLELEMHRLDCMASHGKLDNYDFLVAFQKTLQTEQQLPEPWVSGRDLMALGMSEGTALGRWKTWAYEAQLNGEFACREDLLAELKERLAKERV